MTKPVLVVVDADDASRQTLGSELESRYGAHYQVVSSGSPAAALTRLEELAAEGARIPLILADQWMPEMTGTDFLARAKNVVPTARRAVLTSWDDRPAAEPVLRAAALGGIDLCLPKPAWSPDEQFHRAVTESLEEWWREQGGRYEAVTVIGKEPSARVHEIRDLLTRNNVPFGFHRAGSPEGRAALQQLGVSEAAGPVVALFNGVVLVDPGNAEVAQALGTDVRPAGQAYDVAIVGGGPAGLAAAVYGASEGLATAVLEREAFGGQAGTSSRIRNYLGFPHGVSGVELARRAFEQARGFGAHFIYGNAAVSLLVEGDARVVGLHDGSQLRARAVIIATGVSYRRLAIPGLEPLAGAGVFYGAGTVEAQAVTGTPVFVVGGGNSAGQAALHLAKHASQVTIVVRSPSLAASMSDYLIREVEHVPNINIRYHTEVTDGSGEGHLEHVVLTDRETGQAQSLPAAGLFILIGAQPFTGWLPQTVGRDGWGFILTGPDTSHWPLPRPPFPLETTLPGVFASGDVRHGSIKRVASAVGEGSIAMRLVHDYLDLTRISHQAP